MVRLPNISYMISTLTLPLIVLLVFHVKNYDEAILTRFGRTSLIVQRYKTRVKLYEEFMDAQCNSP